MREDLKEWEVIYATAGFTKDGEHNLSAQPSAETVHAKPCGQTSDDDIATLHR